MSSKLRVSRRDFLVRGGTAVAGGALLQAGGFSTLQATPLHRGPRIGDPLLKELAMRALDAAKSAGATYVDVRLTLTRKQAFYYGRAPIDSEHLAVGIRALVNGAWGFVAGPRWSLEEMDRLGKEAALQARANAWDEVPPVILGSSPTAIPETWSHPVRRDPIDVPIDEKLDYIRSAEAVANSIRNGSGSSIIIFERQDRTFASTDGLFGTQVLYNSFGNGSAFNISASDPVTQRRGIRSVGFISPTAAGYEAFDDNNLIDLIPILNEEAKRQLTAEPLPPFRYDIVFDGAAMASLLDQSIGAALELDRAMGMEANASGTSYMYPLEEVLGKSVAPDFINISAERNNPKGAATIGWDDDGIIPESFHLIKGGIVNDYSTNREYHNLMNSWYESHGINKKSHGCNMSETAMDFPIIHSPNLKMDHHATSDRTFNDLVASVNDGIAVIGGGCSMDHQKITGIGSGEMAYRIRNGKLAETVSRASYLFRSAELWKNIGEIGGISTVSVSGKNSTKGQPSHNTSHTVSAPAAIVKNIAVMPRGEM